MAAPKGNQFAKGKTATRRARNALCRVLAANKLRGKHDLDAIWEAQIKAALEGDQQAAKLIIETLDGKPKQQIEAAGLGGGPVLHEVKVIGVRAK